MQTLANNLELITKYATEAWDKVYKAESRAALLSDTDGKVQFSVDNAKVVKVAKVAYGGLSDYKRNNIAVGATEGLAYDPNKRGYQEAAASLEWETRELKMDRAAKYVIEMMDNEETNGLAVASATTEVNRTQVVPEVDAYCFSQIISLVEAYKLGNIVKGQYVDGVSGNTLAQYPLSGLNAAFKWLDDNEVPEDNRIAFVSTAYFNALRSTPELYRRLDVEGKVDHEVSFRIVNYEGVNLVTVPPRRFNCGFAKLPKGGFTFSATGLDASLVGADGKPMPIDFIVMDKGAAVHVVKYQKIKTLTGAEALANTDLDSTVLFVRIYHDVFVFDNKAPAIYAHVGGFTQSAAVGYDFSLTINGDGIVNFIGEKPAGDLIRIYKTTRSTVPAIGSAWTTDVSTDTGILEGASLTADCVLVGVRGGQVVACKDFDISGSAGSYTATLTNHTY